MRGANIFGKPQTHLYANTRINKFSTHIYRHVPNEREENVIAN